MKFEFSGLETVRELVEEVRGCRVALESIAQSLLRLTEIAPQPPLPDKPMGPETIGSYAEALMDLEDEAADMIRQRLKERGMSDVDIEHQIVQFLAPNRDNDEETM
jgi:hypothetical protein